MIQEIQGEGDERQLVCIFDSLISTKNIFSKVKKFKLKIKKTG